MRNNDGPLVLDLRLEPFDISGMEKPIFCKVRAKVGGQSTLVDVVVVRGPYKKTFEDGRQADYVDVKGWGFKAHIRADRLLRVVKVA